MQLSYTTIMDVADPRPQFQQQLYAGAIATVDDYWVFPGRRYAHPVRDATFEASTERRRWCLTVLAPRTGCGDLCHALASRGTARFGLPGLVRQLPAVVVMRWLR